MKAIAERTSTQKKLDPPFPVSSPWFPTLTLGSSGKAYVGMDYDGRMILSSLC
jgi:hypothetical protein